MKERFIAEVEMVLKKNKIDYRYIGSGDNGGDYLFEYHIICPTEKQIKILKLLPTQYTI